MLHRMQVGGCRFAGGQRTLGSVSSTSARFQCCACGCLASALVPPPACAGTLLIACTGQPEAPLSHCSSTGVTGKFAEVLLFNYVQVSTVRCSPQQLCSPLLGSGLLPAYLGKPAAHLPPAAIVLPREALNHGIRHCPAPLAACWACCAHCTGVRDSGAAQCALQRAQRTSGPWQPQRCQARPSQL